MMVEHRIVFPAPGIAFSQSNLPGQSNQDLNAEEFKTDCPIPCKFLARAAQRVMLMNANAYKFFRFRCLN
jgi:hypothetical protein